MIYRIHNEQASAEIDSLGAQLKSYKNSRGTEYLYQPQEGFWQGSAPVLFPIVGKLKGGKTIIDGKEYSMGGHGFARHIEFSIAARSEDSITFELLSSEETLKQYPFRFKFQVVFSLDGTKLTNMFKVYNAGSREMLFCVGGHPAFRCPMDEEDSFENYMVEFEQKETVFRPFVTEDGLIDFKKTTEFLKDESEFSLTRPMFDNDAVCFTNLKSRKVKLYSKKTGNGVSMDFDGFPYFAVWTQGNRLEAPFVCLEPWTSMADSPDTSGNFEDKIGMLSLRPQGEYSVSFTVDQL